LFSQQPLSQYVYFLATISFIVFILFGLNNNSFAIENQTTNNENEN